MKFWEDFDPTGFENLSKLHQYPTPADPEFSVHIHPTKMDVSKNNGTPKWMVKIMENPMKMDDLGGFPMMFGSTPIFVGNFND